MPFVVDLLADLVSRMSCVSLTRNAASEWLDCMEANRQGLRNPRVPLCPRCKVKHRLYEIMIDLMLPAPLNGN
jgi:hypothetical protein